MKVVGKINSVGELFYGEDEGGICVYLVCLQIQFAKHGRFGFPNLWMMLTPATFGIVVLGSLPRMEYSVNLCSNHCC